MPYVQEAGGVAVGDKVRFLGFIKVAGNPSDYGINIGDVGTVVKAFDFPGASSYDVDFPNQNREEFPSPMILYPGEFEVVHDESE